MGTDSRVAHLKVDVFSGDPSREGMGIPDESV